jgi:GxxExxY protein
MLNDLSRQVIGCALTVLNTLGAGFLEKVYENSLAHELREAGFSVAQQRGVRNTRASLSASIW